MGWKQTHVWWEALREAEAEIESRGDGQLPWRSRYAEVFGNRESLLTALSYTWNLRVQAQASDLDGVGHLCELVEKNKALLAVLRAGLPADGPDRSPITEPATAGARAARTA